MDCNNPLNLMHTSSFMWQGEVPTTDPEGRLCTFDTMLDGVRAGAKNLLSYFNHDDCKTIDQIITRYAPASENPTSAYINFIATQCGVDPEAQVNLNNPSFLLVLVSSIIRFEQGKWVGVPYDTLLQGINEALDIAPSVTTSA
jgi:hypothetical protein